MTKICKKCGKEKSRDQFQPRADMRDGLRNECHPCRKVANTAWRTTNHAKWKATKLAWKRANIVKVRECNERSRRAHPEASRASAARARAAHPERQREATARWIAADPEGVAASRAAWRASNRKKCVEYSLRWIKNHPAQHCARVARRRAIKARATPAWTNHVAVGEFYSFAALKSQLTGEQWQVDHIVPLTSDIVCGLHTHYNLQVITRPQNARKGNRHWPDMPEVRM